MTVEYPSYFTKFQCIADRCPDTCCAGWEVDLDEEAWYRYLVVKGPFGDKLRKNMKDDGEWKYFPLDKDGRCPFLMQSQLCEIYQQLGEEALCTTCREHPRYFVDCGDYEQKDLSLGCPEVARIFFSERGTIHYIRQEQTDDEEEVNEELDEEVNGEEVNEAVDAQRRDAVLRRRDQILSILQDGGGTLQERMQRARVWSAVNTSKLLQLADRMEPFNEEWKQRVRKMKQWTQEKQGNHTGRWEALQDSNASRLEDKPVSNASRLEDKPVSNASRMESKPVSNTSRLEGRQSSNISQSEDLPERWLTRLACYLVFRYWIDAYYEEQEMPAGQEEQARARVNEQPQINLLNRSLALVTLLYDITEAGNEGGKMYCGGEQPALRKMIKAASVFSRQVEFDEENIRLMKSSL